MMYASRYFDGVFLIYNHLFAAGFLGLLGERLWLTVRCYDRLKQD